LVASLKDAFFKPVTSEYTGFKTRPVEQLFRDYCGYRAFFIDLNDVLQEKTY
jgi:hypothetical protein